MGMCSRWKIAHVNSSLRAKERQQQKLITADQASKIDKWLLPLVPITVPSLPLNNFPKQPESITAAHTMLVKTEKIEPTVHAVPPPLWNIKREFCEAPFMARPIDRRREEVNDPSMACRQTTTLVLQRPVISTLSKRSSSTTAFPIISHQEEMIESKSFIHNPEVHPTNSRETPE
jgi:hypothetical protein